MRNLTPGQTIAVGFMCLFGIPICAGLVAGYFLGFWVGVVLAVVLIATIAFIAQRWWGRRAGPQETQEDITNEKESDIK